MSNQILKGNRSAAVNSGYAYSPNVWSDCPWDSIRDGTVPAVFTDWKFDKNMLMPTITTIITVGEYLAFASSGFTFAQADFPGGGLVAKSTTADDGFSLTTSCAPYRLSNLGSCGDFWLEGRISLGLLTTLESSFLLGLMDTTAQTAISPIAADGALADVNLVGFHKPAANTTKIDTTYKANTVTAVEVNSDVGTLVAAPLVAARTISTYDTGHIKLGMKCLASDRKLRFYIDGIECANTKTISGSAGTDFPSDVALRPVWANVCAAGDTQEFSIQWLRCCQLVV